MLNNPEGAGATVAGATVESLLRCAGIRGVKGLMLL